MTPPKVIKVPIGMMGEDMGGYSKVKASRKKGAKIGGHEAKWRVGNPNVGAMASREKARLKAKK